MIRRECNLSGSDQLDYLGIGAEGVSFLHDRSVFKCMDLYIFRWPNRDAMKNHLYYLRSLASSKATMYLVLPNKIYFDPQFRHVIIRKPFVDGSLYSVQSLGVDLVGFLKEAIEIAIECRNIKPDNFVVDTISKHMVCIGTGIDMQPFDITTENKQKSIEMMVKKTFLVWRWPHRQDLGSLLTRCRTKNIPELTGYPLMLQAVIESPFQAEQQLENQIIELIKAYVALHGHKHNGPVNVLDFGCGDGKLSRKLLGNKEINIVNYEPYTSQSCSHDSTIVTSIQQLVSMGIAFDIIICSRVICSILDDQEFSLVIQKIRSLLNSPNSQAILVLALCNPFYVNSGPTIAQQRICTSSNLDCSFCWEKIMEPTKKLRKEKYRPLQIIQQELLKNNLSVVNMQQTSTVGLARFELNSDYLLFTIKRTIVKTQMNSPTVSLLIKVCVMEWRTLYARIVHITHQLSKPRAFLERVLIVDNRNQN